MELQQVENTVKELCAEASAQRDPRKFKNVLIQLKEFMREHIDVIRSMSNDTFAELRKVWHLEQGTRPKYPIREIRWKYLSRLFS